MHKLIMRNIKERFVWLVIAMSLLFTNVLFMADMFSVLTSQFYPEVETAMVLAYFTFCILVMWILHLLLVSRLVTVESADPNTLARTFRSPNHE